MQVPQIGISSGGRPAAACEITQEGVTAAATSSAGQTPTYAAESLPAGAVAPGLAEGNIVNSEAVVSALKSVLGQVEPRTKAVTVVVPDSAVRVFLLDFDTLPSRADEAMPVLRFRLRKSVPFEVEQAGISYQILSEGSSRLETQWKVLAAVIPGPVLAEYEAVVRTSGYEPGAVLPTSLATLAAIQSQEAVLAVNFGSRTLTSSIVSGNDILLYRTVELPPDARGQQDEVRRSIAVSAAFFEDKLQFRPRRLLYSGATSARDFAAILDDPELAIGEVVPRPEIGLASSIGSQSMAGVTGVLMGTN